MTVTLIIILLAFYWLMFETTWLTIRLPMGRPLGFTGFLISLINYYIIQVLVKGKKATGNKMVIELLPIATAFIVALSLINKLSGKNEISQG